MPPYRKVATKFVTTDTSLQSIVAGGATGAATTGTGGIVGGALILPSNVPSPTTTALYNNAGALTWAGSAVAIPAGTTQDVQFNTAGALDADTGVFTYDAAADTLNVPWLFAVDSVVGGDVLIGGGEAQLFYASTPATEAAQVSLSRSRGTYDTPVIVQSGDVLGKVVFYGFAGSDLYPGAYLQAVVDGTPGVDDMPSRLEFLTSPDGAAAAVVRVTISSAGNVTHHSTTTLSDDVTLATAKKLYFGSGSDTWIGETTGNQINCQAGGSGGVFLASGDSAWTGVSDERLKTDLTPIADAAERLNTVRAVMGRWKGDPVEMRRPFLLAQDWQKILPSVVTEDAQGTLGLKYTETIPLMVAAIQEVDARLRALETR